jgi:hypothetical protein
VFNRDTTNQLRSQRPVIKLACCKNCILPASNNLLGKRLDLFVDNDVGQRLRIAGKHGTLLFGKGTSGPWLSLGTYKIDASFPNPVFVFAASLSCGHGRVACDSGKKPL